MDELKTEPAGWGEILLGWKHYTLLPVIAFFALTAIVYAGATIHLYVTPIAIFSTERGSEALSSHPNQVYPVVGFVYLILIALSHRLWREWKPDG